MRNVLRTSLKSLALSCALSTLVVSTNAETNPRQYAVEVSAAVQATPAQIALRWAPDASATGYTVYRKALSGTSWSQVASLGNVNNWTDTSVANGGAYEYSIQKTTSIGYKGTGYIYAGINAPMTESRGKMVLIVDNTYASALASEMARLQQDLVGDGWTVIRHDVSRTDSPVTVKNLIKNAYNADPANVKSVFLFGHVPVPYSGNFNPDGHPDHQGAWVADTYYADMDGSWTDSSVNNSSATKPWNRNVPGDGKFDQSELPSNVELQVGRVDMYNLTCFANKTPSRSELDLLRAYLNKHNAFRHGRVQLNRRGAVCDNFGERSGEAFAATGWRTMAPFFGAENNVQLAYGTYFTTLKDQPYLWSYGTGGGSWYTCNGVGSSDDFALNDLKSVFTTYLGSYFGDWDNESAFMRASLGSGYVLATAWGGRPHWFFHHMGLGETIGYSAKISQNNGYGGLYGGQNFGTRGVHVTLLGDPTLRLHPVIPPSNVSATAGTGVTVAWTASTDANIQGYVVYRGSNANGPFTRVSGSGLIAGTSFVDGSGASGNVYMVRAVKLEQSGSGTYHNPSQGIFATAGGGTPQVVLPAAPSGLTGSANSSSSITIRWTDNSSNESGFRIVRRAGVSGSPTTLSVGANTTSYTDSGLSAGTPYLYEVYSWNSTGNSATSPLLTVTTLALPTVPQTGTATFVADDWTSSGNWKANYGSDGYMLVAGNTQWPTYGSVSQTGGGAWTWAPVTPAPSGLETVPGPERTATCWYAANSMNLAFNFTDSQTHRVAIYMCDHTYSGRQQVLDVLDSNGNVTSSRSYSNYGAGVYAIYNISGKATIRVRNTGPHNAVVSGVFFGSGGLSQSTPPSTGASVRYLGMNSSTRGTWKGTFGTQGYQVITESANLPSYATVTTTGKNDHVWIWNTADSSALQKGGATDRLAACWYAGENFDVKINITDGQTHKVSFYTLDWDRQNRSQTVQVIDSTGAVVHTTSLSNFQTGTYLSYDVKGAVTFRFVRTGPYNSVVSGIFFDTASAPL